MTSNLTSKTINPTGVKHFKKLAKMKKAKLGCKLSEAQEIIAKEHGFKNWNNVLRFAAKRSVLAPTLYIWRKKMFIELKGKTGTYSHVRGTGAYDIEDKLYLEVDRTINLGNAISFWTDKALIRLPQYASDNFNIVIRDHNSELFTSDDYIETDAFLMEIGTGESKEIHTYVFTNKDEYHRVMKSVSDVKKALLVS